MNEIIQYPVKQEQESNLIDKYDKTKDSIHNERLKNKLSLRKIKLIETHLELKKNKINTMTNFWYEINKLNIPPEKKLSEDSIYKQIKSINIKEIIDNYLKDNFNYEIKIYGLMIIKQFTLCYDKINIKEFVNSCFENGENSLMNILFNFLTDSDNRIKSKSSWILINILHYLDLVKDKNLISMLHNDHYLDCLVKFYISNIADEDFYMVTTKVVDPNSNIEKKILVEINDKNLINNFIWLLTHILNFIEEKYTFTNQFDDIFFHMHNLCQIDIYADLVVYFLSIILEKKSNTGLKISLLNFIKVVEMYVVNKINFYEANDNTIDDSIIKIRENGNSQLLNTNSLSNLNSQSNIRRICNVYGNMETLLKLKRALKFISNISDFVYNNSQQIDTMKYGLNEYSLQVIFKMLQKVTEELNKTNEIKITDELFSVMLLLLKIITNKTYGDKEDNLCLYKLNVLQYLSNILLIVNSHFKKYLHNVSLLSEIYLIINNIVNYCKEDLLEKEYIQLLKFSFNIITIENQAKCVLNYFINFIITSLVYKLSDNLENFKAYYRELYLHINTMIKGYLPNYISIFKENKAYLQVLEFLLDLLKFLSSTSLQDEYLELINIINNYRLVEESFLYHLLNDTNNKSSRRYNIISDLLEILFSQDDISNDIIMQGDI